jgi:hypothetical protein
LRSTRIRQSVARAGYRTVAGLLGATGLKKAVREQLLPHLLGALQLAESTGAFEVAERHVEQEIERLFASKGPIVVGPWLSEVGFELLYWIPLLHWIKEKWDFDPERLVVVSRGGVALWYRGLCNHYLDIFDGWDAEQVASMQQMRWARDMRQKQAARDANDETVLEWVGKKTGLHDCEVLHPSLMYRLFWPELHERLPVENMLARLRFKRFAKPALPELLQDVLPQDYVAMRFYFRPSFPDCPANRNFVAEMVKRVSRTMPVVLLKTGFTVDDHIDCPVEGVVRLEQLMTPSDNLEVQSVAVAHARAFIGSYGGLSYLAPFFGLPSIGFYSDETDLKPVHRSVAHAACQTLGGRLIDLHTSDVRVLDSIL